MATPELGELLLRMRKDAGLTQAKVQEITGIDAPRISRFERGIISPDSDHLVNLAKAYGVDRHVLLFRAGIVELPGFGVLLEGTDETEALDRILSSATVEERRELAKHLARIRISAPLVDEVFGEQSH